MDSNRVENISSPIGDSSAASKSQGNIYCTLRPFRNGTENGHLKEIIQPSKLTRTDLRRFSTIKRRSQQYISFGRRGSLTYSNGKSLSQGTAKMHTLKNAKRLSNSSYNEDDLMELLKVTDDKFLSKIKNRFYRSFRNSSSFRIPSLRRSKRSNSGYSRNNNERNFHAHYCTLRENRWKINNGEKFTFDTSQQRSSPSSSSPPPTSSFINPRHSRKLENYVKSSNDIPCEPESIENCLEELDTYLDEIDRRSSLSSISFESGDNKLNDKRSVPELYEKKESPSSVLKRNNWLHKTLRILRPESIAYKEFDKNGKKRKRSNTWCSPSSNNKKLISLNRINDQDEKIILKSSFNISSDTTGHEMDEESSQQLENGKMSSIPTEIESPSFSQESSTEPSAVLDDRNPTDLNTICDILNTSNILSQEGNLSNRPRQYGRRSGDYNLRVMSAPSYDCTFTSENQDEIAGNQERNRSHSAYNITDSRRISRGRRSLSPDVFDNVGENNIRNEFSHYSNNLGSETSSLGSSRVTSPTSIISSIASSSTVSGTNENVISESGNNVQPLERSRCIDLQTIFYQQSSDDECAWPHKFSRPLALLCCTLGLFNISRFAILTVNFGGNFLLQFCLLSILFGIPMLWLQMCLGAKIKNGPLTMWRISPICKGIGIALLLVQFLIALYTTVSLGWTLIYLRDAFISVNEKYNWERLLPMHRKYTPSNSTGTKAEMENSILPEAIANYFTTIVLQRLQVGLKRTGGDSSGVRFQLAFNLAVIWTLVFIILCKGWKSYGKAVFVLVTVPFTLLVLVNCKLLSVVDYSYIQNTFSSADFEDFLVNSKTWIAAAQETFLTWVLFTPSIISMSSKSIKKNVESEVNQTSLRRDAIFVVIFTLIGLSLAAIFGYACVQILHNHKFIYSPGSYENRNTYLFLYSLENPLPTSLVSMPIKWSPHYSSVLGECYYRPQISEIRNDCNYQGLRLITELFPAAVAVATSNRIEPFWTIMGLVMFLIFGIGQLCAMWKPISTLLGNLTSSVLLSCIVGLLLGIPFTTEIGIATVHYLDIVIGGSWWILILWTIEILAVFLIRGRPYNGDVLVNDLKMSGSISAFLALSWNVLIPVGLITLSIIDYKTSLSKQFFSWRGKLYFDLWARKIGCLIQTGFLLIVPFTAIIQTVRYLRKGPPDILDRIQLLYRPTDSPRPYRRNNQNNIVNRNNNGENVVNQLAQNTLNIPSAANSTRLSPQDDFPPKYTPPPSYTTATGGRIAKLLRQSIRRSIRRIRGELDRERISTTSNNLRENLPNYSRIESVESDIVHNNNNPEDGNLFRNENINIELNPIQNKAQTHDSVPPMTPSSVAQLLRSSSTRQRRDVTSTSSTDQRMDLNANRAADTLNHQSRQNEGSSSGSGLIFTGTSAGESSSTV